MPVEWTPQSISGTVLSDLWHYAVVISIVSYLAIHGSIGYNRYYTSCPICELDSSSFSSWTRDVNSFAAGSFTITCMLQISRIMQSTFRDDNLGTFASYATSLTVSFIAAVSTNSVWLLDYYGGVCEDVYGLRLTPCFVSEWLVCVPLLMFIAVSCSKEKTMIDRKISYLNFYEWGLIVSSFFTILFGFLTQTTSNITIYWIHLSLSLIAFFFGYYCMYFINRALNEVLNKFVAENDHSVKVAHDFACVLASRKKSLIYWVVYLFLLFPALYFLRVGHVISNDIMHTFLMLSSTLTKVVFVSICMDSGLEVTNPSTLLYIQEVKANEKRRAFLRYVFHEIRVPLNSISLGLELLLDTEKITNDSPEGETLVMINDAVKFMGETMNDVFAVQKIEEGALKLIRKPFSIEDLVMGTITSFGLECSQKNLKIIQTISADAPKHVIGDKYRLKHVLGNIVANAIKYSHPGAAIQISVSSSDSPVDPIIGDDGKWYITNPHSQTDVNGRVFVRFVVTDHGLGMNDQDVENVFVPFLVTKAGDLQSGRGSGVSMAIAKEIVKLHNGHIFLRSIEGQGSTFVVVLPFSADDINVACSEIKLPEAVKEKLEQLQKSVNSKQIGAKMTVLTSHVSDDNLGSLESTPVSHAGSGDGIKSSIPYSEKNISSEIMASISSTPVEHKPKIFKVLVVDDVLSNRKLLGMLLTKKGMKVDMAEDGSIAVAKVQSNDLGYYDFIFMDNTMPNMTGIEATGVLRKIGYNKMILGLTGNSMEEELVEFATKGADLVLTKPLHPKQLDLLLTYFQEKGTLSVSEHAQGLHIDEEKVILVPKKRPRNRSRSPKAR